MNEKYCSIIQIYEDIEEKHIFTSIKGHNSVGYQRVSPICNPKPLIPDSNLHAKFEDGKKLLKLEAGNKALMDGQMDRQLNGSEGIT